MPYCDQSVVIKEVLSALARERGLLFLQKLNNFREGVLGMVDKKPQRIKKEQEVAKLQDFFVNNNTIMMTDYRGISVSEDSELRKELREAGINYLVAKNTLLKIACNNAGHTALDDYFADPTAIAFGDNPVEMAKILSNFIKKAKKTQIKVGLLDGNILSVDDIDVLAKLPSREEMLAKILGSMQAPLYGFAGVTTGMLTQLVNVVDAVREKKEQEAV
jgi:large subunit ribosomal protein L10